MVGNRGGQEGALRMSGLLMNNLRQHAKLENFSDMERFDATRIPGNR